MRSDAKPSGLLGRCILLAPVALLTAYGVYLTARVIEERRRAPAAIHKILQSADPAACHVSSRHIAMLIRVEDPTFWTNRGIDLTSPGGGLTTISQGLGKSVLFNQFTPGLQKIELMVLTRFALTRTVSKRDILAAFLDTAYLGDDRRGEVIGFAEGSRRWMGKPLDRLDDAEFLTLVAMLPRPNELDPVQHGHANRERVRRIERLLRDECTPRGLSDVELEGCA